MQRARLKKANPDERALSEVYIAQWLSSLLLVNAAALGVTLVQDVRENRYKATYPHAAEVSPLLEGEMRQSQLSRSYGVVRSHKEAMRLVLTYVWTKHQSLHGGDRPAATSIDAAVAHEGFSLGVAAPLNTTYRAELAAAKAAADAAAAASSAG